MILTWMKIARPATGVVVAGLLLSGAMVTPRAAEPATQAPAQVPTQAPAPAPPQAPAHPRMKTYYLGLITKGPKWTAEATPEVMKIQEGHLANINRLWSEGKLVVAGPIAEDGNLRGIFVFDVASMDEAKALAATDPAVQAGRLVVEFHPWMVQDGVLPAGKPAHPASN
jgi:uncharacterized protein